jgi:hypothetical protein
MASWKKAGKRDQHAKLARLHKIGLLRGGGPEHRCLGSRSEHQTAAYRSRGNNACDTPKLNFDPVIRGLVTPAADGHAILAICRNNNVNEPRLGGGRPPWKSGLV